MKGNSMRNRYFNAAGKPIRKDRYYAERNRLYQDTAGFARRRKPASHICAVEYMDDGLYFLVDRMLPGDAIYAYARTHARAYIHARHHK